MTDEPLYLTIAHDIALKIRQGVFLEAQKLPSERSLSSKYHVSRFTIRSAIAYLESQNIVYTLPGNGTFVSSTVIPIILDTPYSFHNILSSHSSDFTVKVLSSRIQNPSDSLRNELHLEDFEMIHHIELLYRLNKSPVIFETHSLLHTLCPQVDYHALTAISLDLYCAQHLNIDISSTKECIQSLIPSKSVQDILNLSALNHCLHIERFSTTKNRIFLKTDAIVRGDKFSFHVSLK